MTDALHIRPAVIPDELPVVRELFREYADGLGVDLCFQGFEAELAGLPGAYTPPSGRLMLAVCGESVFGCVALRRLSESDAEMKRLYVRPSARGRGAGWGLVSALIVEAEMIGYRRILLDTLPTMTEAIRLYESVGFHPVEPYCHNPCPGTRYLALELGRQTGAG